MVTSPWAPTLNGWTEWASRDLSSVGMPSLSKGLLTTAASV